MWECVACVPLCVCAIYKKKSAQLTVATVYQALLLSFLPRRTINEAKANKICGRLPRTSIVVVFNGLCGCVECVSLCVSMCACMSKRTITFFLIETSVRCCSSESTFILDCVCFVCVHVLPTCVCVRACVCLQLALSNACHILLLPLLLPIFVWLWAKNIKLTKH